MSNYHVSQILKEKKITDFLHERGIFPVKKSALKWVYKCPIHEGDNDPSFVVYPAGTEGREYQTYHCFGCLSGINIINLMSDLDGVPMKTSIQYFLQDMDIDSEAARDAILNEIQNRDGGGEDNDYRIEHILLMINSDCRRYLEEQDDELEVKFFDDVFFKKVDAIAISGDVETLEAYLDRLLDKNVLEKRAIMIKKEREEEYESAVDWRI